MRRGGVGVKKADCGSKRRKRRRRARKWRIVAKCAKRGEDPRLMCDAAISVGGRPLQIAWTCVSESCWEEEGELEVEGAEEGRIGVPACSLGNLNLSRSRRPKFLEEGGGKNIKIAPWDERSAEWAREMKTYWSIIAASS